MNESIPHISLTNFLNEDCTTSRYVLTSPRSLEACKRAGVKPIELLPRTLEQVKEDISKHYLTQDTEPTREHTVATCDTTAGTCYAVWEELERDRRDRLELARRERDRIIIENYREKKQLPEQSTHSTIKYGNGIKRIYHSESNQNLRIDNDTAKPNTRSLANRGSFTHQQRSREAMTSSPNFSLTGTLMSRKGLISVPASEKRVLKRLLDKSAEDEYSQSLRHYWGSLWEKERAQSVTDRWKREDTHQQQIASIRSMYEREESRFRKNREEEDRSRRDGKERRIRESDNRHRAALDAIARQKEQALTLSQNNRSVNKRLQEHRLRVSELKQHQQPDTPAVRSESSTQLANKQIARYRNVVWSARSRLAHLRTQTAENTKIERSRFVTEDKMGAADIRQSIQRDRINSEKRAHKERDYLKGFRQQLSLRQQEADRDEWLQEQEARRRQREALAEEVLRDGVLARSRSASEKRRSRAQSQLERRAQERERELEWRRSVAGELDYKEQRVERRAMRRNLEAKEHRYMSDLTEQFRNIIKEQSGKKGFNELVKSTEQFHRLGHGPRGYQKNQSYSNIIS